MRSFNLSLPPLRSLHPLRLSLLILLVILVAGLLSLSACENLSALVAPAAQPLEQAAVAAAVEATVKGDPVKAARVVAIAREVLVLDSGTSAALADIEIIVNAKVAALSLPPADQLLAAVLVAALGQAVQQQLAITTKGAVSPQTQIAIASVCKWVIVDAGSTV